MMYQQIARFQWVFACLHKRDPVGQISEVSGWSSIMFFLLSTTVFADEIPIS
jgi:hypothetical protein